MGGAIVLILVLAVAIPALFGGSHASGDQAPAGASATDHAAQSTLVSAMTDGEAAYADNGQTFTGVTLTSLQREAPRITWVGPTTPAGNDRTVSVALVDQAILLASRSGDGQCWYILSVSKPTAEESPQLPHSVGVYRATSRAQPCEAGRWPAHWTTAAVFPAS